MASSSRTVACAFCAERIPAAAEKCPHCGERQFEDAPRKPDFEATDLIVPTNVSGWSILACYLGLIGFLLPVVGFFFAAPALVFAIVALRRKRKSSSYGAVTSDVRAIFGLILGGLGTLIWGSLLVLVIVAVFLK